MNFQLINFQTVCKLKHWKLIKNKNLAFARTLLSQEPCYFVIRNCKLKIKVFKFKVTKQSGSSSFRVGEIVTSHGKVQTPAFMPCGTVGAVKSVSPDELKELGTEIVLANTYHLHLRPGEKLIKKLGGLHNFMNWDGPILTDSGGFQVFSLGKLGYRLPPDRVRRPSVSAALNLALARRRQRHLARSGSECLSEEVPSLVKIKEKGVEFRSHLDGSNHFFTPEKVIDIQLSLGSDIMMPLDYCPAVTASKKEIERAVELTLEWAKRSLNHCDTLEHMSRTVIMPALFGIVQGGTDKKLPAL